MFKSFNKLLVLPILLFANTAVGCHTEISHLGEYMAKKRDSYSDFNTSIDVDTLENIMVEVLDYAPEFFYNIGKVIALPDKIQPTDPWFTKNLIKRTLFCFMDTAEKSSTLKYGFSTLPTILMQGSYEKALAKIQITFDYLKNDNVSKLLSQNGVVSYFADNLCARKKNSIKKTVNKADVYIFLKACFPSLYKSNIKICERNDWEEALKKENAWDKSRPQFFEITIDEQSYVVKSSWRTFEYANSLKLYDLLKKDENEIVAYPTKFALYDINGASNPKAATIEIFVDITSPTHKPTEDTLLQQFLKNNQTCYGNDRKFSSSSKKIIFQLMPKAKGKSVTWFLDSNPQVSPQLSYKIGQRCGETLAALHKLGYDEKKKCTTSMHGDLHFSNLIYDDSQDKVMLIDVGMDRQDDRCGDFKYYVCENDFSRLFYDSTGMAIHSDKLTKNQFFMPQSNDIMFMEGLLSRYQQINPSLLRCFFDLNTQYSRDAVGYYYFAHSFYCSANALLFARLTQYMIFIFHYCEGRLLEDETSKSILKTSDEIIAMDEKSPIPIHRLFLSNIELLDKAFIFKTLSDKHVQHSSKSHSLNVIATHVLEFVSYVEEYLTQNKRSLDAIQKVASLYSSSNQMNIWIELSDLLNKSKANNFMAKIKDILKNS
ncbi:MAG: hypothetical protein LBT70_02525 [Holosporaceae bacterium]|jgi:hypothetical protein|nr:hypothetical protein [Holosporaceae bacterium]